MLKVKAIAPAGITSRDRFLLGKNNLEWGFDVSVSYTDAIFEQKRNMAGSEENRAADFLAGLTDDTCDVLWAIRGGFGANRLLPFLPTEIDADTSKKLLVGYSDITALQWFCYKFYGMQSISGHMIQVDFDDMPSKAAEHRQLFELIQTGEGQFATPSQCKFENFEPTHGTILGGCLSVIAKLCGTPYMPDLLGKILFLEDLNEEIYRLDGLFSQLKNAGVFESLRGVVLGQFSPPSGVDAAAFSAELHELFEEYFFSLDVPIIWDFPIGHIAHIHPLPIGFEAEISRDTLRFKR